MSIRATPWLENAACRTPEGEQLFLAEGNVPACKEICARCPERKSCLSWALGQETTWGVWGGHTVTELNKIRAGLPVPTLALEQYTARSAGCLGAVQATGPAPPRRRVVRLAQLPGAHTPPVQRQLLRELVSPADTRPAAQDQAVPQPPNDGPGSPMWEALATSPTVRAWAIADGWHVHPSAPRVPGAIVLAYRTAHPGETP